MIDAQPGVAPKCIPKIVPESIDVRIRMHGAQAVDPTLPAQSRECVAHLDPKQRIVHPSLRLIDIALGRNDVVIAGENDRRLAGYERSGMHDQALEPT